MIAKKKFNKKRVIKKHSWQDKLAMTILACLTCLIIGFLVIANLKLYSQAKQVDNQFLELNSEIMRLEKKNQELKELFSAAEQPEYSEKFLRENAMYKKKGETVVVIKREEPLLQESIEQTQNFQSQSASIIDKAINFFKNIFGR